MHMNSQTIGDEIARLSEAAKSLIEATSEMAGAGVEEARQRLAAAFASSRAFREELKAETTATLAVVAGMTVVYAVVAWLVYRKIVRLVRSGGWFAESRAQCRKDAMWISQMNL